MRAYSDEARQSAETQTAEESSSFLKKGNCVEPAGA
jgi:hypothetical protein